MNTGILIQAIINGIMVGGIYAMIGMSLNMIFGVMKIVNFCQGELLMVSMYITYLFYSELGIEPFIAIPLVAVIMFALGALIQSTLITRSIKEDGIRTYFSSPAVLEFSFLIQHCYFLNQIIVQQRVFSQIKS